jgi:hypothetical protein
MAAWGRGINFRGNLTAFVIKRKIVDHEPGFAFL